MALMNSGVEVLGMNDECPTWEDIALGLSRQPRFGGQCRKHWTVLHHSMLCHQFLMHSVPNASAEQQLEILLHDAHECFMGDVPTTWKTKDRKMLEKILDMRIRKQANLYEPTAHQEQVIHHVDRLAYLAEGREVGPCPNRMMELEGKKNPEFKWTDRMVIGLVVEYPVERSDALRLAFMDLLHSLLGEIPPQWSSYPVREAPR